ncbi:MAG: response regulator [Candidatus Hydrogenedentes bacterium]|nr:response regulator [Candidatus Hydrogenedentota bacterium]
MNERKPSLLILDDAAEYLHSLELVLRGHFRVQTAGDADMARKGVQDAPPDAALIDVCLDEAEHDDRSGLEFVEWLGRHSPNTKVVVMSALDDIDLPRASASHGAAAFLKKPVDIHELRKVLKDLLNHDA